MRIKTSLLFQYDPSEEDPGDKPVYGKTKKIEMNFVISTEEATAAAKAVLDRLSRWANDILTALRRWLDEIVKVFQNWAVAWQRVAVLSDRSVSTDASKISSSSTRTRSKSFSGPVTISPSLNPSVVGPSLMPRVLPESSRIYRRHL